MSFLNAPINAQDLFAELSEDSGWANLLEGYFALAPAAEHEFPIAPVSFLSESTDSSATSPSSSAASASPPPQVPILSPVGSPRHVQVNNEMDVAALPMGVESAPAASQKRKMTSSRSEADTKAATPVQQQQLSKRQRANARTMKREAHNKAERDRRDELKDGYASLRMALPTDLSPDRKNQVELLHAAALYIRNLQTDSDRLQHQMLELRSQSKQLSSPVTNHLV